MCMCKDKIYQTVILYVVLNESEESEGTVLDLRERIYEELHKVLFFRIVTL